MNTEIDWQEGTLYAIKFMLPKGCIFFYFQPFDAVFRWECQQPLHHHRNQDNLLVSSSSIKQDCEGLALCQWCVQSFKHFRLLIPRIWIRDICITRRRAWIFDFLGGGGRKRGKRQVMPIGSTKKLGFSTPLEYWRKSQFWLNHYIFQGPLRSTS